MRVWYRTKARIWELFSPCISPEVPATNLPQEVIEMIVAHLIYHIPSLLACSLTCYSWYIATVPHLHHTIIVRNRWLLGDLKRNWPEPLRNASRLGLLPLVKRIQVCGVGRDYDGLYPNMFNRNTLGYFSALSKSENSRSTTWTSPNSCRKFESTSDTSCLLCDPSPSVCPKDPTGKFYSSLGCFSI